MVGTETMDPGEVTTVTTGVSSTRGSSTRIGTTVDGSKSSIPAGTTIGIESRHQTEASEENLER